MPTSAEECRARCQRPRCASKTKDWSWSRRRSWTADGSGRRSSSDSARRPCIPRGDWATSGHRSRRMSWELAASSNSRNASVSRISGPRSRGSSTMWSGGVVAALSGGLLRPRPPAAVAAGNVETSQRIVDVLFLALSEPLAETVPAQSQGTMNNVTIGGPDPRPFSYYETIAGGEGALPYRPGMAGVHTHMTNTRNTPIEALEFAYPLRIEEYRLIPGTGGRGQHSGGDGIRRSVRLLARKGTASILSERRALRPKGLEGGDDGRPGKNLLVRRGRRHRLPAKVTLELRRGDLLVIETPGGGGWGPPERRCR